MECVDFFFSVDPSETVAMRADAFFLCWLADRLLAVGELARFRKRWRTVYVKRLLDSTYTMQVGLLASF